MSSDNRAKAQKKFEEGKDAAARKLENDGVVNPSQFALAGLGPVFVAFVPVASYLATPGGLLEKAVNGVCHGVAYFASAGASSAIAQSGKIAALSALYITVTYALTGAASVAAKAAGHKEGLDNNNPRKQAANLDGLPLRMQSAHSNLMEMFPGFALTAALTQALAPGDPQLTNLLGLHVLSKVFLYYPSYLLDVAPTRSLAHLLATSSVIAVALKLALKPIL